MFRATYCESDVAVKKLNRVHDATSEEAFRHECAILKGCRNPHIVSFVGVCKDEAGPSCLHNCPRKMHAQLLKVLHIRMRQHVSERR